MFKDSPITVKRKSIVKYYLNNPPQTENDEMYEKDKHYKHMEKVNKIISCKANHIDETHLEFKTKKQVKKELPQKNINYTIENAKSKKEIKELKEQNKKNDRFLKSKMSMQLPMKHLSCNKIVNNKMIVHLKTLSKFAPSVKASSQQLLQKEIENIIKQPRNPLKQVII